VLFPGYAVVNHAFVDGNKRAGAAAAEGLGVRSGRMDKGGATVDSVAA
jgi:hypothetical protein